jgi:peptide/nickel transport system substrate-binding protein
MVLLAAQGLQLQPQCINRHIRWIKRYDAIEGGVMYWDNVLERRINRRRALAAFGGGAAAVLVACGGDDEASEPLNVASGSEPGPGAVVKAADFWQLNDETSEAVRGGVYTASESIDFTGGYDPMVESAGRLLTAAGRVYEFLLTANRGPGVKLGTVEYNTPQPNLAEGWEASPDLMSYTFRLRPGVKFQDISPVNGREMNIDDWRTSFERFLSISTYGPTFKEWSDSAEYPDDRTMVLKMKFPYAPLPMRMVDPLATFLVMPRELNEDPELAKTKMIGSNYQILDKDERSVSQEYRGFPGYWRGEPFIARWHYPIIPEVASRQGQFVAQNIMRFDAQALQALQVRSEAPQAMLIQGEISPIQFNRMSFGTVEAETAPWRDSRVRIALRKSLDWDALTDALADKENFAAAGIDVETRPSTHMGTDPLYWLDPRKGELGRESQNYLFDLAAARQLMEAAGYTEPVEIDGYIAASRQAGHDVAFISADEWNGTGLFQVNVQTVPTEKEFTDKYLLNNDYKGMLMSIGVAGNEPDYVLYRYFHSSRPVPFRDPELDRIIDAQRREPDILRRASLIQEFQKHMAKEFYLTPGHGLYGLWSLEWPWLHNRSYTMFPNMTAGQPHKLWLDPDLPARFRAT